MNWLRRIFVQLNREGEASDGVFRPPVTPDPAATRALEQQWQRRRAELAGWQPSNGWQIDGGNAS